VYSARLADTVDYVEHVGADAIIQPWHFLPDALVDECHANGLIVHVSLIDNVSHWQYAVEHS